MEDVMRAVVWKAAAVVIVFFWLGMNGQLIRVMLFPEQSRLTEVPASFVAELFLKRAEPSQLVVLKSGRRVGEVSVGSREQVDAPNQAGGVELNLAGSMALEEAIPGIEKVSGRLILDLGRDLALRGGKLRLRVPGSPRGFELEFSSNPLEVRYRLTEGGQVTTDTGTLHESNLDRMKMLLALWGLDVDAVMAGAGSREDRENTCEWKPVLAARRGQIRLRGERFHGYLLEVKREGGDGMRCIFSEAGELMRVTTFLDYELLSEVFVPQEA